MEELDKLRITIKKRYIYIIVFLLVLFSIFCLFLLKYILKGDIFYTMYILYFLFFCFIIGIVLSLIFTSKLTREYTKLFKEIFVKRTLEEILSEVVYDPNRGIPYDTIAKTNMMNMGDIYHSEDYISAKYKNIRFEQSDVHIEEERESKDSDGNTHTHYVTIFQGRWMIFDFNKEFKANVQISQKGFSNSRVNVFWGKKENRFKKVSMESETFNKKFNVYAQNEHDAFYIITPSLMERIERLENENKGKLLFCFIDNKLHIGIYDSKNAFEPGSVFKEIDEEKIKEKTLSEIRTITRFVDELNLDNNLFKKEE